MARKAQPAPESKPEAESKTRKVGRGGYAVATEHRTTAAEALATDALKLYREGVPWHEAIVRLGCGKTAYYDALTRGKAAAREALADAADDLRSWETEQGMQAHHRLLADAESARQEGNAGAAIAAERAASTQRERLAALWGVNAPAKADVTVEAPDILSAIAGALATQAPGLLGLANGGTMGADDGED